MFDEEGNPESEAEAGNLGAADEATETEGTVDTGEAAEADTVAITREQQAEFERMKTERALWLRTQEKNQKLETENEALRARSLNGGDSAPTKPTTSQAKDRVQQLRSMPNKNADTELIVTMADEIEGMKKLFGLASYPAADQPYLQRIVEAGVANDLKAANLMLKGWKAEQAEAKSREEESDKSAASRAVVKEGERRAAVVNAENRERPAAISSRPVSAGAVSKITKMKASEFGRRMETGSLKEQSELSKLHDNGKIEIVD